MAQIDDLEREWLLSELTTPGVTSPEVAAVFARMSALTQTEMNAIEAFVDGLVFDGLYTAVDEIYAPCLNATDFLTGFKVDTLINSASPGTHTPGQYIDFSTNAQHLLEGRAYDSFAGADHFMGCYVVFTAADTTANSDLFGLASLGVEAYYRWRGNDTSDANSIIHVTGATPRAVNIVRPTGDVVGAGFDGVANVIELIVGGVTEITGRTFEGVPTLHPVQWHGQNLDGTPAAGNMANSRYSIMFHLNKTSPPNMTTVRTRTLQFLNDIGVIGVPAAGAGALATLTPKGDQNNDLWMQLFQANGATSDQFNDAASEFLTGQGFTGDLNQQWFDYWEAGGGVI